MYRPQRTLLALIGAPGHVCYRYRLEAFAPWLAEAGWKLEPVVLARGVLPGLAELGGVAVADAIVLQRYLLPWWRLELLRRASRRLLFDFDDAVFYRDSNRRLGPESSRRSRRFAATLRMADAVLAGNRFLVEQAARETAPSKLHLFPTCIDLTAYPAVTHTRGLAETRLVWIGSRSTAPSLFEARPGLQLAAERLGRLTLHLICDWFPDLGPAIHLERRPWTAAGEIGDLIAADIGISWLPDHPWSLGKCGLKVLQYMAAGLPVVANPVGVHCELIEHGRTGFLAQTPGEWADAIARLAASPELRAEMGQAGRQSVAQRYATAQWGPKLADLLNQL
jgi:glycosyltransferase involved in cell wall biosynthesis